jgi:hypothetical protein
VSERSNERGAKIRQRFRIVSDNVGHGVEAKSAQVGIATFSEGAKFLDCEFEKSRNRAHARGNSEQTFILNRLCRAGGDEVGEGLDEFLSEAAFVVREDTKKLDDLDQRPVVVERSEKSEEGRDEVEEVLRIAASKFAKDVDDSTTDRRVTVSAFSAVLNLGLEFGESRAKSVGELQEDLVQAENSLLANDWA